ncbi:MAG: hypothetical protein OXF75_13265 [Acidimicrobiaceae bacterium]|nr:hypothetical protein [Acidimicrobiaceae bacterium]
MSVAASVLEESEIAYRMPAVEEPRIDDRPVELELVTLVEWETRRIELSESLARRLGNLPWLSVQTDREEGVWKVTAKQWVGAFSVDGLRIIVRPKINPQNLFLLLEVGLPEEAWQPEAIDYAETDDLLAALISFFARTAETTLARGHYHSYRHEQEDLLTLRGRLDFSRQFRRGGLLVPMACSYDDFTADVAENRYLKAAMRQAIRVAGVPPIDRRRLMRLLAALEDVADMPVEADDLDRITFTRLNEHYLPAMRLARLILANLTLQDQHGDTTASAFMLDMNDLFERFVTERLRQELSGRLEVEEQKSSALDTAGSVRIRPDLLFSREGVSVGVADIKYKLRDTDETPDSTLRPDEMIAGVRGAHTDYYQLLAYTTALGHRCGTLIYCVDANETGDGDATDRFDSSSAQLAQSSIEVRNVGTQLHAVGIDLSGSPQSIRDQITALADHLIGSLTEPETVTAEVVAL